LSVKFTQSSDCTQAKSNRQYYHLHYHCLICAALAKGKQAFLLFVRDLLLNGILTSMFESDERQTILFAKKQTLEAFLFR
jgi:hypothetical protein